MTTFALLPLQEAPAGISSLADSHVSCRGTPLEAQDKSTADTQQEEEEEPQRQSAAKSGRPPRPARQALKITKKLRPAKQDVTAGAVLHLCCSQWLYLSALIHGSIAIGVGSVPRWTDQK